MKVAAVHKTAQPSFPASRSDTSRKVVSPAQKNGLAMNNLSSCDPPFPVNPTKTQPSAIKT